MTKLKKFDAADYLDNEETIAEYLTAALEDENPEMFLAAIHDVAKARGISCCKPEILLVNPLICFTACGLGLVPPLML